MSMQPKHASAKQPRRGLKIRAFFLVCGFLLAAGAAALAYFTITVIYAPTNFAVAQASSLSAPTNPTSATETAATTVEVGWTNPGTQLSGAAYQVTSTPGGITCTSSGTSCAESGLSPGTNYSFSVVAALGTNWQSSAITTSFTTLGVTTTSLPSATYGSAYPTTLTDTGGTGVDTWTLTSGTLPAGLTLNTNGTFSGKPTSTTAESGLVFTATDSLGFTATSPSLSITVLQDSTTTTITYSTNTVVYGNESSVVFTPTVTTGHGEVVPNGSVITVSINSGAATCTVTIGTNTTCTIGTTALLVGGPFTVSASFGSTANLLPSSGNTSTGLSVTPDGTTTTVSEAPTTVVYGNETSVIFSPHVTATHGETVPGVDSVTINVGSASCTTTISTGSCTIANNTALGVSASAYPVTATFFTGDPDLTTSTSTAGTGLTVTQDPTTTTTVTETATTVVYGNEASINFGATVAATHGETVPGADGITIHVGTASCTTTVSGTCTIGATALGVGATNSVTAVFAGDTNLATSTSTAKNLAVTKDSTTTTVSEAPTSVAYNSEASVTFTPVVTTHFGEAVPSGDTITVSINSGAITCTVTLPATSCTIANTALNAGGPYTVSATFNGDGNLSTSSGNAGTGLTVTTATQAITYTGPTTGVVGTPGTLSATGGASGNPVVFTVDSSSGSGVCSVSGTNGTTVTFSKAGNCVIRRQPGGHHQRIQRRFASSKDDHGDGQLDWDPPGDAQIAGYQWEFHRYRLHHPTIRHARGNPCYRRGQRKPDLL